MHWMLPFVHGIAKGTVAAHVAHHTGAASATQAAGHVAAGHAAATGAAVSAATKVSSTGAVAKGLASGAAAKTSAVHAAHGTMTPVGHVAVASTPKSVVAVKHVAKKAVVHTKPFKPVVPPAPPVH